jgi:sugar transferase (PEP-CTERM/EpsH1 system associated)
MMSTRRPRVLLFTHRVPYPPDKGDRIRSYQLLRFLAERCEVHLATLADEAVSKETHAELKRLTARLAIGDVRGPLRRFKGLAALMTGGTVTESMFHSPFLERQVNQWVNEAKYDLVFLFSSSTFQYLPVGTTAVCDLCDVDSEKWLQYSGLSPFPFSWLYRMEGKRLRRIEARIGAACRAVTLVTRPEKALFLSFCPAAGAEVVPVSVDLARLRPTDGGERDRVVFVGALDYRPNIEGMRWFCETVWPQACQRLHGLTLSIVGRNPPRVVRRLSRIPGVEVVGPVRDVRPFLRRAAVAIAPLHIARGVQNKVLEALAMGKAVLATPQAAQGIDAVPDRDLLVADTADDWVRKLCELLCDDDLRQSLGFAGRRYVETHHNAATCFAPLERILRSVLGSGFDAAARAGESADIAEHEDANQRSFALHAER